MAARCLSGAGFRRKCDPAMEAFLTSIVRRRAGRNRRQDAVARADARRAPCASRCRSYSASWSRPFSTTRSPASSAPGYGKWCRCNICGGSSRRRSSRSRFGRSSPTRWTTPMPGRRAASARSASPSSRSFSPKSATRRRSRPSCWRRSSTNLTAVVAGTTLGMLIADVPVVLLGNAAAVRIPLSVVRKIAAALFAVMGFVALFFPGST